MKKVLVVERPPNEPPRCNGLVIDWNKAPGWALFAARDRNGVVYFYPSRPTPQANAWYPAPGSMLVYRVPRELVLSYGNVPWDMSLVERPTNEGATLMKSEDTCGAGLAKPSRTVYEKQADDLQERSKRTRADAERLAASAKFLKSKEFKAIVESAEQCGLTVIVTGHCS